MRESKTQQLFRQLRERIESGIYPVGSRFPSEYLLADKGTEYYLVCYTEHGSILRYFSTKTHEYRENGTDAFSE